MNIQNQATYSSSDRRATHPEKEEEPDALVDKGPTTKVPAVQGAKPLRPVLEEWWDRALSPKLRKDYEAYLRFVTAITFERSHQASI